MFSCYEYQNILHTRALYNNSLVRPSTFVSRYNYLTHLQNISDIFLSINNHLLEGYQKGNCYGVHIYVYLY
jgi:hypothetical protein